MVVCSAWDIDYCMKKLEPTFCRGIFVFWKRIVYGEAYPSIVALPVFMITVFAVLSIFFTDMFVIPLHTVKVILPEVQSQ